MTGRVFQPSESDLETLNRGIIPPCCHTAKGLIYDLLCISTQQTVKGACFATLPSFMFRLFRCKKKAQVELFKPHKKKKGIHNSTPSGNSYIISVSSHNLLIIFTLPLMMKIHGDSTNSQLGETAWHRRAPWERPWASGWHPTKTIQKLRNRLTAPNIHQSMVSII